MTGSTAAPSRAGPGLLAADEPAPFTVENAGAASPFLLISDHAGRRLPRALGDLGVAEDDLQRHIAWDLGAAGLASQLARGLDAWLIQQTYSRLVIDCNRPPGVPGSIPVRSERTEIPGNRDLSAAARAAREAAIFHPYHARIAAEIEARQARSQPTVLVSVHSFTPVYMEQARRWHLGVLYGRDARLAHPLRDVMRSTGEWQVGDNEPYAVSDATDYAVPVHGERGGLRHVAIEVRQDLLATAEDQLAWAERLGTWLEQALALSS
ncbi:N-formylglutamate amidohydrolase [Frateuria aurantia]